MRPGSLLGVALWRVYDEMLWLDDGVCPSRKRRKEPAGLEGALMISAGPVPDPS